MMTVSLLCPSRYRATQLEEMVESARAHADSRVQVVVYADADDPTDYESVLDIELIRGPRVVLSAAWNICQIVADGPIYGHLGDDIRFRTSGWDTKITEAFASYPDNIVLVHGDDGIHGRNLGTHSFLHEDWVNAVGYFVPPLFSSDYNDTWLNEVADSIGRRHYLPDVYTEHLHVVVGKAPMDRNTEERLERHARDNPEGLYERTAHLRDRDANRLREVMA